MVLSDRALTIKYSGRYEELARQTTRSYTNVLGGTVCPAES